MGIEHVRYSLLEYQPTVYAHHLALQQPIRVRQLPQQLQPQPQRSKQQPQLQQQQQLQQLPTH